MNSRSEIKYLSVCSGIEAATVAWHELRWEPVAFSEIESFPCKVLAHHYPDVPNWGDMTKFRGWPDESIDVLVGGTPCQSFSVAGLRQGLKDPRGELMLNYLAIAARYRPRWVVWENVPGVLSSNGGRDFGAFLGALGELGYGWAYRVLDAQWFGVAQRRRRVFVVGCLGDGASAAKVLFESESVRRDPPSRRSPKEDIAGTIAKCSFVGGASGRPEGAAGNHFIPSIANSLVGRPDRGGGNSEGQRLIPTVARSLTAKNGSSPRIDWDRDVIATFDHQSGGDCRGLDLKPFPNLQANQIPAALTQMKVRRLTVTECERLQGFPDDYTNIRGAKDGPRYKALGNSMAVPCMKWIGQRITNKEGAP